jgi:hypothetical protein
MSQHNHPNQDRSSAADPKGQDASAIVSQLTSAPYEAVLMRALDKLTSQVFIFLLAYTMLLIGLAVFGAEVAAWLRNLLYIIPILGVLTYVLLRQRRLARKAAANGVQVRAGVVRDSAYVAGIRGVVREFLNNVRVSVGWVSGEARVGGVDQGEGLGTEGEAPKGTEAQYLLSLYKELSDTDRSRLLAQAMQMHGKAKGQEDRPDG